MKLKEWEREWMLACNAADIPVAQRLMIEHNCIECPVGADHLGNHVLNAIQNPRVYRSSELHLLLIGLDGIWKELSVELTHKILSTIESLLPQIQDDATIAWWGTTIRLESSPGEAFARMLNAARVVVGPGLPTVNYELIRAANSYDRQRTTEFLSRYDVSSMNADQLRRLLVDEFNKWRDNQ